MNNTNLLKKYVFWPEIDNKFHQNIDFRKTPIKEVVANLFDASSEKKSLQKYIFQFYSYNEHLNTLRNKSNEFIDSNDIAIFTEYQKFLDDFSQKIFSYILFCCLAEAKYSSYLGGYYDYYEEEEKIQNKYVNLNKNNKEHYLYSKYLKYAQNYEKNSNTKFTGGFGKYLRQYLEGNFSWDNKFKDYEKFKEHYVQEQQKNNMYKVFDSEIKKDNDFSLFLNMMWNFKNNEPFKEFWGDNGNFHKKLLNSKFFETDPNVSRLPIEKLLNFLTKFFLIGFDYAYGGRPWSNIADHALSFAKGEINTEMFLDKSLSLEHNGGNMFNKNYIFPYESDNDNDISIPYIYDDTNKISTTTSINLQQFLFNCQNSCSLNLFHHLPQLKKLNLLSKTAFENLLKTQLPKIDATSIANLREFTQSFENVLNTLKKQNSSFIIAINKSNFTPVSFNLANFLLAQAKSTDNDSFEKNIINNKELLSVFDKLLVMPLTEQKLTTKNIKKIVNTFNVHNLNNKSTNKFSSNILGGKAKGITELMSLGLNVPKAMTFDTKTCLSYLNDKDFFNTQFKQYSQHFVNYLKDEKGMPILVSVRSGAPISMPGMMDSILNVGIDTNTYPILVKQFGKKMIDQCVLSFMSQFCSSKLGLDISFPKNLDKALDKFAYVLIKNDIECDRKSLFPLNVEKQIKYSVEAVFDSWNSPRAQAWRNEKNIDHNMGTAATIQQMVFGNKNQNSLTAVIFSRDCISGKPNMMGEFLIQAQGEDLVSGRMTPKNIDLLKNINPTVYNEILNISQTLENTYKAIQDIEITVEDNKVYVLQKRNAIASTQANILLAKEMGLNITDILDVSNVLGSLVVDTTKEAHYSGLSANPGVISGIVVRSMADINKYKSENKPLIFLSDQALPEHAPIMIATDAFITQSGGATSHAAILARSMNKPCVVGLGKVALKSGSPVTIDANKGYVWKESLPIITREEESEKLASLVLSENNITLDKEASFTKLSLDSWVSKFSSSKVILNNKPKYQSFLSIAQKTAAVLLSEKKGLKLK